MKRRAPPSLLAAALLTLGRHGAAQPPPAQPPEQVAPAHRPAPPAMLPDAAPAPPSSTKAPDVERARKLHAAGQRFYDQGDYPAALGAFEQAYAAAPRPNLLLSQATTRKKLFFATGLRVHKEKAVALYRAFLAAAPRSELTIAATAALESLGPPEEAAPADAPATLPEPPRTRTTLAIDSTAEGALISVDDGPAAAPQVNAEVTPGRHVVRVVAPGYVSREVTVQAIADQITPEQIELEEMDGVVHIASSRDDLVVFVDGSLAGAVRSLSLRPGEHFISVTARGRQSLGARVLVKRGATTTTSFEPAATSQRHVAIVVLAAGGAGLVAGGIFLALALDRDTRAAELDQERQGGSIGERDFAEYQDLQTERDTLRTAGVLTTTLAASTTIVGLSLLLLDHPDPLAPPAGPGDTKAPPATIPGAPRGSRPRAPPRPHPRRPVRARYLLIGGVGACLGVLACSELSEVEPGVCGNHVVESGEDCDDEEASCGDPEAVHRCRHVWSDTHPCPAGFNPGADGRCRKPSGRFGEPFEPIREITGRRPRIGDHDGDGHLDVMVDSLDDNFGAPFFLDRSGDRFLATPGVRTGGFAVFADVTGDGIADVTAAQGFGIAVRRGTSDRRGDPRIFGYDVPGEAFLMWQAQPHEHPLERVDFPQALFLDPARSCGESVCLCDTVLCRLTSHALPTTEPISRERFLATTTTQSRSDVPSAASVSAIAMGGAHQLIVTSEADPIWGGQVRALELIGTFPYLSGLVVRDLDRDGDEDLGFLRATSDCKTLDVELVRGPSGFTLPTLVVERLGQLVGLADCFTLGEGPALAFVNDDAEPDLVLSGSAAGIYLRVPDDLGLGPWVLDSSVVRPWTAHAVGDVNGDGLDDVVAAYDSATELGDAYALEITLGGPVAPLSSILTLTPERVKHVLVADVDGDGLDDVVAAIGSSTGSDCGSIDSILVAFGRASGFPEPPVRVGGIAGIAQLSSGGSYFQTGISDIGITATCSSGAGVSHQIAFLHGSTRREPASVFPPGKVLALRLFPGATRGEQVSGLASLLLTGLSNEDDPEPGQLPDAVAGLVRVQGDADLLTDSELAIPLPTPSAGEEIVPQAAIAAPHLPDAFVLGSLALRTDGARPGSGLRLVAHQALGTGVQTFSDLTLGTFDSFACRSPGQVCAVRCVVPCSGGGSVCADGSSCEETVVDGESLGTFCQDNFAAPCGNEATRWSFATLRLEGAVTLAVVATAVPFEERAAESTPFSVLQLIPWGADGTLGTPVEVPLPAGSSEFVDVVAIEGEGPELVVATDVGVFRFDADGELIPVEAGAGAAGPALTGAHIVGLAHGDFTSDGLDDLMVIDETGARIIEQLAE